MQRYILNGRLSTGSANSGPSSKELILRTTIFKVVHLETVTPDDCHLVVKECRTLFILTFLKSEFILQWKKNACWN